MRRSSTEFPQSRWPRPRKSEYGRKRGACFRVGITATTQACDIRFPGRLRSRPSSLFFAFPNCLSANRGTPSASSPRQFDFASLRRRPNLTPVDRSRRSCSRLYDTASGGCEGFCSAQAQSRPFLFTHPTRTQNVAASASRSGSAEFASAGTGADPPTEIAAIDRHGANHTGFLE